MRVVLRELKKRLVCVLQVPEAQRGHKPVKLFFLIPDAVLFDDETASQVLQQILPEVIILLNFTAISIHRSTLGLALRARIDVAHQPSEVAINDVLKLLVVDIFTLSRLLSEGSDSILLGRVFKLVKLLLSDSSIVSLDLVENGFLESCFGIHDLCSGCQKRPKALLSCDHIRITLSICRSSHDFVILKRGVACDS